MMQNSLNGFIRTIQNSQLVYLFNKTLVNFGRGFLFPEATKNI